MRKKLIAGMLCVILSMMLGGCGEQTTIPASEAVAEAMTALQAGDNDTIERYFGTHPMDYDEIRLANDQHLMEEMNNIVCSNMTYEVTNIEENKDSATATLLITNKDMTGIMASFVTYLLDEEQKYLAMDEEDRPSDEELIAEQKVKFVSILDEQEKTTQKSATVTLAKEKGQWTIESNDELRDAVSGGLISLSRNLIEIADSETDPKY